MAFSLQFDPASSGETHAFSYFTNAPADMTSDPLADSRDKVVEVSGFVAINIVRVSSREVGEVGGEVGVDGEPEEEGDDCQGGPCGVDGLVSGRSSEHVIVRSLQMTAFSHGCIMESAKVHSNLVLQVKESGQSGGGGGDGRTHDHSQSFLLMPGGGRGV